MIIDKFLLEQYLNKIKLFTTKYNNSLPKSEASSLTNFIEQNFNEDFWRELKEVEKSYPKYINYYLTEGTLKMFNFAQI